MKNIDDNHAWVDDAPRADHGTAAWLRRWGQGQRGAALFVSLIMLVIMTILGLSSVQTTSMEERMAQNASDTNRAFQSAESAIRDAEGLIDTWSSLDPFNDPNAAANGLYNAAGPGQTPVWLAVDWAGDSVIDSATPIGVPLAPRYLVEYVRNVGTDEDSLNITNIGQDTGGGRANIYRITALGTGGTATARVMIQSTYGRRF